MLQNVLIGLGFGSLFRPSDGVALTTVVLLVVASFWLGFLSGAALLGFAVSPSLRNFIRTALLRLLLQDEPGRRRLERYRQD